MKKLIAIMFSVMLVISLSGCVVVMSPERPSYGDEGYYYAKPLETAGSDIEETENPVELKRITLQVKEITANILQCSVISSDDFEVDELVQVVNYRGEYPSEIPFHYDEIIVQYEEYLGSTIIPEDIMFTTANI